jgi:hypothetical protein
MMVCTPSAKLSGVNVHTPLLSAVAVAAIAFPSTVKCTTAFGSTDPVNASFDVILSVEDRPVSVTRLIVTLGAISRIAGYSGTAPTLIVPTTVSVVVSTTVTVRLLV